MQQEEYVVYKNIKEYIGSRNLATNHDFKMIDDRDAFINKLIGDGYIKIQAMSGNKIVYIVLVYSKSPFSDQTAKLKALLESIHTSSEKKEEDVDEIILIVRNRFIEEKRLMNAVKERAEENKKIYYRVCPFYMFIMNIFKKPGMAICRIMTEVEVEEYLKKEMKTKQDINTVSSTADPVVTWLGARKNQFIDYEMYSENAMKAYNVRRVI